MTTKEYILFLLIATFFATQCIVNCAMYNQLSMLKRRVNKINENKRLGFEEAMSFSNPED